MIEVLDPIAYPAFAEEEAEDFTLRVRELIGDHLEKAQVQI
jgi:hypothetical protein